MKMGSFIEIEKNWEKVTANKTFLQGCLVKTLLL